MGLGSWLSSQAPISAEFYLFLPIMTLFTLSPLEMSTERSSVNIHDALLSLLSLVDIGLCDTGQW